VVRLSAGREHVTDEAQSLCFLAGANSTFVGFKLLTTVNPERSKDESLLARLGMRARRRVSRRSLLEPLVERLTGHLAPCSIAAGQGALS
jgi:biotin synthase-like enzyme